jgi:hypothetical protein
MTPSIDTAKNLAALLETTVGYLLGENENADLFKKTLSCSNGLRTFFHSLKTNKNISYLQ